MVVDGGVWQDACTFLPTHRRALGYVFQEASPLPHLSVRDNLAYGWKRVPPAERNLDWDAVLDWLGLALLIDRAPHQL